MDFKPPEMASRLEPDVRFAFVLAPRFSLLPLAGFVDSVRHSSDEADRSRQIFCHWDVLGHDLAPVPSSSGLAIAPWRTYADAGEYDYIVVVGGLTDALDGLHPSTLNLLRDAHANGARLVGLCTGSFVLAQTGLMAGRRAAVHAHHRLEFSRSFPEVTPVESELYVSDGDFLTCPGGTSAIDLAVEILIEHCGRSRGMKGLTALVVDEHRAAHRIGRLPYEDLEECGNWRVERAVRLMRQKLQEPDTTEHLAKMLGSTVRQLNRDFQKYAKAAPQEVWREIRLQNARWRLMNSKHSITQIAFECGFANGSHLSRLFKARFGDSPKSYRAERRVEKR